MLENVTSLLKKRQEKKKKNSEKKKVIATAQFILFSELLGSCLIIFYIFLFYAKIYITQQDNSFAYIALYIFSDAVFLASWITSIVALILRNDTYMKFCKYSLGVNVLMKMIYLYIYTMVNMNQSNSNLNKFIVCLIIIMIIYSILYIFLFTHIKKRWISIPIDKW